MEKYIDVINGETVDSNEIIFFDRRQVVAAVQSGFDGEMGSTYSDCIGEDLAQEHDVRHHDTEWGSYDTPFVKFEGVYWECEAA